jgi:hypothetical protein
MSGIVTDTLAFTVGREDEILAALGITPPRRGKNTCPTPGHDDRDPSWRFDWGRGRWHCSCGGGSLIDLVQVMNFAHDAVSAARWMREVLGLPPIGGQRQDTPAQRQARQKREAELRAEGERRRQKREQQEAEEAKRQLEKAQAMWMRSEPAGGTIVQTYLRSRGLQGAIPTTVRYLPPRKLSQHPAMISAFCLAREIEPGRLRIAAYNVHGVHLTLLKPDGSGKADVEFPKLTVGRGHDFPVVLAALNDGLGLVIAEGIEDAMAWHQRYGVGAWAAGAANRLRGLARHIPHYTDFVAILCDDDHAGISASSALFDELGARDIEAKIVNVAQEVA